MDLFVARLGCGLPARVQHVRFLGDQAALEIATQGLRALRASAVDPGVRMAGVPARTGGVDLRRSRKRARVSCR